MFTELEAARILHRLSEARPVTDLNGPRALVSGARLLSSLEAPSPPWRRVPGLRVPSSRIWSLRS